MSPFGFLPRNETTLPEQPVVLTEQDRQSLLKDIQEIKSRKFSSDFLGVSNCIAGLSLLSTIFTGSMFLFCGAIDASGNGGYGFAHDAVETGIGLALGAGFVVAIGAGVVPMEMNESADKKIENIEAVLESGVRPAGKHWKQDIQRRSISPLPVPSP